MESREDHDGEQSLQQKMQPSQKERNGKCYAECGKWKNVASNMYISLTRIHSCVTHLQFESSNLKGKRAFRQVPTENTLRFYSDI